MRARRLQTISVRRLLVAAVVAGCAAALATAGFGRIHSVGAAPQAQAASEYYQSIPRPSCGVGSMPETGFQGEVPAADRASGRSQTGYRCNLELVGQSQNEGASWQNTWYGHCDYYDTADNQGQGPTHAGAQQHPGTAVVDVSDPAHPSVTEWLTTPAMLHPWESLKVNQPRGLLAGHLTAGPWFDVYDVSADCAHPKLLSSVSLPHNGHEGEWSPDGMTYWGSSTSEYHAVDVSDPGHPKEILEWAPPCACTHGLSISDDGTRAYFTTLGSAPAAVAGQLDGLIIADVSDVQYRRPNPQVRVLSQITWPDGNDAQHTIPMTIGGRPFLAFVDETGSGGIATNGGWNYACAAGLPPFGVARIFDISDEHNPKLVSRLTLQTDDPANCAVAAQEVSGQAIFGYDSHYCSVDQRHDPTAMACGYFNSGIRVFDIRDPYHPKEIAYFNPPAQVAMQGGLPGSEHLGAKTADWCSSQVRFIKSPPMLWAQCQDNGFMTLRFTNGAYPLAASTGGVAASPPRAAVTASATPAPPPVPAQQTAVLAPVYVASHPGAVNAAAGSASSTGSPGASSSAPPATTPPTATAAAAPVPAAVDPGLAPLLALLVPAAAAMAAARVRPMRQNPPLNT